MGGSLGLQSVQPIDEGRHPLPERPDALFEAMLRQMYLGVDTFDPGEERGELPIDTVTTHGHRISVVQESLRKAPQDRV
jgi:hypothetical protein